MNTATWKKNKNAKTKPRQVDSSHRPRATTTWSEQSSLEHWLTRRPAGLYAVCVNNVALQVGLYGDAKNKFSKKNSLQKPLFKSAREALKCESLRTMCRVADCRSHHWRWRHQHLPTSRQRHVSVLRVIPTYKCTSSYANMTSSTKPEVHHVLQRRYTVLGRLLSWWPVSRLTQRSLGMQCAHVKLYVSTLSLCCVRHAGNRSLQ